MYYNAIVAIRVRSPEILAQVGAVQRSLLDRDFDRTVFHNKPISSLHITLAHVRLAVKELER
jgi:hypothetical protein